MTARRKPAEKPAEETKAPAREASKDTGPSHETRQLVLARDGERCQWCGKHLSTAPSYSLQHRVARGMGGTRDEAINSPANLVTMCGSGTTGDHGWVESHPNEARERGFRVDRGTDPAGVPIVLWNGAAVHLTHDGRRVL